MQTAFQQTDQIRSALAVLSRTLGDSLIGIYLHGSAVSGGLQIQSDIDLLAVTGSGLTAGQRNELLAELLRLSARHPALPGGSRCLEVMVFCQSDLARDEYPARAAFVYGEWLRDAFAAGESPMPHSDPEYTLVLAQAAQEAIALHGPPQDSLLPAVSPERVRKAIRDMLPALLESLHGDERNVLLTLARMWHTASTGAFVAKNVAAEWAMTRLSDKSATTMDLARRAYLGQVTDDWSCHDEDARRLATQLSEMVSGVV